MLRLPTPIRNEMTAYRMGLAPIPQSYLDFHKRAASLDLRQRDGWTILEDHGLVSDGWADGAKFRSVTVAMKTDGAWVTHTLKWHESGAWFVVLPSGAQARFAEMTDMVRRLVEPTAA